MDRSLTQRRLTLWVSECVCVKGGGEKEDGKKSIPYSTRTSREKEKETHTKEENYGTTRRLATFRYTSHEAKKNVVYVVVLDDVLKWIPLKSLFSFPPFFFFLWRRALLLIRRFSGRDDGKRGGDGIDSTKMPFFLFFFLYLFKRKKRRLILNGNVRW